ncbi:hypothetical protein Cgig2_017985 [Carnegiea gigantea]|uniref:tRNA-splicing endonuclease subunit Sen54 N-terminal domain-containing protein n=1 Tax=Carnegiea gigantea TaxID=171969 RepID=A0A9Q1JRY0_9CARY|nr:hypothetical protein Cgig2_017985 [Carnegiea gigantea]
MEFSQDTSEFTSSICRMEAAVEEWSSSSAGVSDSETCLQDSKHEEFFYEMGSLTKLQFRKDVSKACWKDETGMAEVLEHKGRLFTSMGINRNGKIYFSLEETLFLAEIGALVLVGENHTTISLKELYEKVAEGKSGCCWEGFEVYRHLKSLGYIVGRYGIPWSLKSVRSSLMHLEDSLDDNSSSQSAWDRSTIVQLLKDLHIREAKPTFEVYLPNKKFRKTCPGDPSFVVYLAGLKKAAQLERQCKGIPLKVSHVDHGRVSFFSFDKAELPVLQ